MRECLVGLNLTFPDDSLIKPVQGDVLSSKSSVFDIETILSRGPRVFLCRSHGGWQAGGEWAMEAMCV